MAGCPWFPGSQVQSTGVRASGPTRERASGQAHRPSCLLMGGFILLHFPFPPRAPAHLTPHGFS